jgi:ATP-binding cassette, subfamily B, bacterial
LVRAPSDSYRAFYECRESFSFLKPIGSTSIKRCWEKRWTRQILPLNKTKAMANDSDRPTISLAHLLRPYATSLAFGLVAVILEGAANLAEPWPLKVVLDAVLMSKSGHGWLNEFLFSIAKTDKSAVLRFAALAVLFIAAVGAICNYIERHLTSTVSQYVIHDLRQTAYSHIHRLSLDYHDQKQTGDLISRLTSDIDAIQTFITSGLLGALVNGLMLVGMITIMFCLNWQFTLAALSVTPVLFVTVFYYTRRIKKVSREVRKKEGEIVSLIQDVLSSIRAVKAFAREEYEERRLAEQSLESVGIALRARNLKAKLSPLVDMIVAIGTCLVLWVGGGMALKGTLSAGSLVLFVWYLSKMYKPMRDLSKMTDTYSKAAVGFERIRELLETDRHVKDLPGARHAHKFRGGIELDGVCFGYQPNYPVLKQVSLIVKPGQVAALVGPTGAGKTTIISLISRFYDPNAGVVRIDGTDVRLFEQKSLRQQISFVLQETLLFRGPVWYNIAYGNPDARHSDIVRAARQANAHEFIERLPHGYDTVIGERGTTLSGGQRQRIAIARAVIRDSPILVLDEPAAGLDAASEELVFDALGHLMKGRTAIVIAHKLSTIRSADVIFVLNEGEIVERGRHTELLRIGGLYAELHELQFGGKEPRANA